MMAGTTDTLTVPETPDLLRRNPYPAGSMKNLPKPKACKLEFLVNLIFSYSFRLFIADFILIFAYFGSWGITYR